MSASTHNNQPQIIRQVQLAPGSLFAINASQRPITVATLLGSCVSACLFDPKRHIIGMNHFLLARSPENQGCDIDSYAAERYGQYAMPLLVKALVSLGAKPTNLKAKLFGGADVLGHQFQRHQHNNPFQIGLDNINFAKQFLLDNNIELSAWDLGGKHGRKICFHSTDFDIYLTRIPHSDSQTKLTKTKRTGNHHHE